MSDAQADSADQFRAFLERYPKYETTSALDELRATEFSRLDEQGHVYLDYTGGSLYARSQIREHGEFLLDHVIGNPHSSNPTSAIITERVERCRSRVLDYFNASPEEYTMVFTANASHALKLVGEAYPFCEGAELLLSFDNHNSVNGIREFDRARNAVTRYLPVVPPDLRVSPSALDLYLSRGKAAPAKLFAYPAQSNFSGVQHPLEWIELPLMTACGLLPTR